MNRNSLNDLSRALRALHRHLLALAQRRYELANGEPVSPWALLRLANEDAAFAWLKPLRTALAELDQAIDGTEEDAEALGEKLDRLEALLNGSDAWFAAVYRQALQSEPDIAVAHGQVRQALRALALPRAA